MSSKYYMTPDAFMAALSDAIRETYYPNEQWDERCHPQDIAYNVASVCEAIAGFMGSVIYSEGREERQREAGLDRLIAAIKREQEYPDLGEMNDAYVEPEDAP